MNAKFDVAIVGASLAGSSLALQLGLSGLRVALFDKSQFPRRKLCGEGLSLLGIRCLERLGLKQEVFALPHRPYNEFRIWNKKGPVVFSSHHLQQLKGIGIERSLLDHLVLTSALNNGMVDVFLGTPVESINNTDGLYRIDFNGNAAKAKYLVLACGSNSRLVKSVDVPDHIKTRERYACGVILNVTSSQVPSQINLFLHDNFEAYCTPLGGRRLNMNFLGTRQAINSLVRNKQTDILIDQVKQKLGFEAEIDQPLLGAGPFGRKAVADYWGKVILIGDCRESLDPIGGMGMSHALMSSALLGAALIKIFHAGANPDIELKRYARQREDFVKFLRGYTRIIRWTMSGLGNTVLFPFISKGPLPELLQRSLLSDKLDQGAALRFARMVLKVSGRHWRAEKTASDPLRD